MSTPFPLPDPGDGSKTGTVVQWFVKGGDPVTAGQPLIEVMFDQATVEISASSAGRVARLCAKKGADVRIGAPLLELD